VLTYGQTGSGKTHTLVGCYKDNSKRGLISRVIEQIFSFETESSSNSGSPSSRVHVSLSCLEIYQERVIDLLSASNATTKMPIGGVTIASNTGLNLRIRETPGKGVWVEGITELSVTAGAAEAHEVKMSSTCFRILSLLIPFILRSSTMP